MWSSSWLKHLSVCSLLWLTDESRNKELKGQPSLSLSFSLCLTLLVLDHFSSSFLVWERDRGIQDLLLHWVPAQSPCSEHPELTLLQSLAGPYAACYLCVLFSILFGFYLPRALAFMASSHKVFDRSFSSQSFCLSSSQSTCFTAL